MENIPDFSKIWASNSPRYAFTDEQYLTGWPFIGSTPPPRQAFDALQFYNDTKLKWLFDRIPEAVTEHDLDTAAHPNLLQKCNDAKEIVASSNSNGNIPGTSMPNRSVGYIKFSDGTLICWDTAGPKNSGRITVTFPVSFVDQSYHVCVSNIYDPGRSLAIDMFWYGIDNSKFCIVPYNVAGSYPSVTVTPWIAIGRWK